MPARPLCILALAVAAVHLAAWQALGGRLPSAARSSRGAALAPARRVAWVSATPARVGPAQVGPAQLGPAKLGPVPARAPTTTPGSPRPNGPAGFPAPARSRPPAGPISGPPVPWPVYATRPPPALRLSYALRQTQASGADLAGRAELAWSGPGPGFTLRLASRLPGRAAREWVSEGGFDRAGLAPRRLVQHDGGRVTRRIELDGDAGSPRARPGTATPAPALAPGAQDRWSWLAQLAAIAETQPRLPAVAHVQVAGLRGELDRWTFRATRAAALPPELQASVPGRWQAAPLLHLVREPERPYDLRVEAWLAPAIHHFPIALRLATPPSRWTFALWLDADDADAGRDVPRAP
jgi:hypothetical protein